MAVPPFVFVKGTILDARTGRLREVSETEQFECYHIAAGSPMSIFGNGFLRKNDVWVGSHRIEAASRDGQHLLFLLPLDIAPGTYPIYVENKYGKTKKTDVPIRGPQPLRISAIQCGSAIHPGEEISLCGSGFLLENKVWFGNEAVDATLSFGGDVSLKVVVPPALAPGSYPVYFSNANGQSQPVTVVVAPAD